VETSVAILAGGRSRRMGRDKALLPLGGATVVERVAAAAKPLSDEQFVVANERAPYEFLGLPVVEDIRKSAGPLGGLQAALHYAKRPVVCLLACDLPFLTTEFLRFLSTLIGGHQAVIPLADSRPQPLCAFYSVSCLTAVENALEKNDFRMDAFHESVEVRFVEHRDWGVYDPDGTLFANVNHPEDYERARELLAKFEV
jgi:molybdopterin-guanine dinucleotide biosynthesis protein A